MLILDARQLLCPLPVIKVQDRIATLTCGDRLKVYCTDPGAMHDIPAWCRINGHELIEAREEAGDLVFVIRVVS